MNKFTKKMTVLAVSALMALGVGISGLEADKASAALTYTGTYEKVTSVSALSTGDKVVVGDLDGTFGMVSGQSGSDATISTTESDWVQYEVTVSGTSFTLYDSSAAKYIASPTKNQFTYGTTAGSCTVTTEGGLQCNKRILQKNGNYYRFYTANGSYPDLFVYKVGASAVLMESITIKADGVEADTLNLNLDDMYEGLTVEYAPSNVDDSTIDWTSTNRDVAYYEDGVVYAMGVGEATITATAHDGSGVKDSITVYVVDPSQPVLQSVTVTGTPVTPQFVGNEFNYSGLTFTPVYDKTNDNPDVITGADIDWPTLVAGMTSVTGNYKGVDVVVEGVTVKEDTVVSIAVSGDMTKKEYHLEEEWDPAGLVVTATYESGATAVVTEGITWEYSAPVADYEIGDSKAVTVTATVDALVSEGYEVTGITINEAPAVGSAEFDFMNESNTHLSASALASAPATIDGISVGVAQNGSTIAPGTYLAPVRMYKQFLVTFSGDATVAGITSIVITASSASYANVMSTSTWNPTATVSVSGSVATVEFASAPTEVTVELGAQSRWNSLVVNYNKVKADENAKVESITLSPDTLTLDAGDTGLLSATVLPGNAFDTSVTWASSKDDVATVSQEGLVTAVAVGEAKITATANDGSGVVGEATVTVNPAPVVDFVPEGQIKNSVTAGDVTLDVTQTGAGTYTGFNSTYGAQFGSGTNDVVVTLESTGHKFETTGLRVLVNAAKTGSGEGALRVLVGDVQIGETVTLTSTATVYEFTPSAEASVAAAASDTLKIELSNTSGAVYLKSLAVYGEMSEVTEADKLAELVALIESLDTCTDYSRAAELREMYNALSDESKAAFDATVFEDNGGSVTLADKLAYMEMLAANAAGESSSITSEVAREQLPLVLISLVAVLSLSAVGAYYFLNKKRNA